ncbi:Tn3 family transposase [Streptomyces milbemycinicus]|uniref:Tn3 family transposase n=1 Tax=Streptomyces milbemycinicus TaxID=476552 RepID=UPI0033E812DA
MPGSQVAVEIANATFAARVSGLWGAGSTAVASDSTHFRSWDQNLFTQWHSRYGGRGILMYWHVECGSAVVHSQTLRASAPEVAAMVEGAIRHGTTMSVEGNYVDSHGQSQIGFGITRLLNVDQLPRIKQINRVRLNRPNAGQPGAHPNLTAAQAMLEIGRAQRTIFVARYPRERDLQREIEKGLNVVESWNAANAAIYYGKGGEISTNRRDPTGMSGSTWAPGSRSAAANWAGWAGTPLSGNGRRRGGWPCAARRLRGLRRRPGEAVRPSAGTGAMARGTSTYDERLRDLEAEAFRTGRTPAEHGGQLQRIGGRQAKAFGNIFPPMKRITAPCRSVPDSAAASLDAWIWRPTAKIRPASSKSCEVCFSSTAPALDVARPVSPAMRSPHAVRPGPPGCTRRARPRRHGRPRPIRRTPV